MKRTFVIPGVLLALASVPFSSAANRGRLNSVLAKHNDVRLRTQPATGKIIFRELMFFHPDPEQRYFEAGILKAPEHEFRIQVSEKSSNGISTFSMPLEQLGNAAGDVWLFEFASSNNQGVSFSSKATMTTVRPTIFVLPFPRRTSG
jgi:hypothetical protein